MEVIEAEEDIEPEELLEDDARLELNGVPETEEITEVVGRPWLEDTSTVEEGGTDTILELEIRGG